MHFSIGEFFKKSRMSKSNGRRCAPVSKATRQERIYPVQMKLRQRKICYRIEFSEDIFVKGTFSY